MIKKGKDINASNQTSNRILVGTSVTGELKSKGDIRIDGSVNGNVEITGKLVVGEKGEVEGEVKCAYATVSGSLRGNIEVTELLSLESTAKVHGDIITNKLSVETGAEFTGSCSMGAVVREIKKDQEKEDTVSEATA